MGLELGNVQFVQVEPNGIISSVDTIVVANMIAQKGYGIHQVQHQADATDIDTMRPPIRYGALEQCLEKVASKCVNEGFSLVMPRVGCSLAGGSWSIVSEIIEKVVCGKGVDVTIYDYPGSTFNP